MGGKKQRKKKIIDRDITEAFVPSNISAPARNLRKTDLGAVIFGCKHSTMKECLSNQLFGLPGSHYSYIKNISQGLVLFLFNYSDRKLHGIYEAASSGQMNINKYAWVADGDDTAYTNYPAQVRIRVRQLCKPLAEKDFKPIIADNYYEAYHFYFELDHDQTNKLITLFTSSPTNHPSGSLPAKKHAGNATQQCLSKSGFNYAEQYNEKGWSFDSAENLNHASGPSYASVISRKSTRNPTDTSSQAPQKWSTLFKTQSDFELSNDDDWELERNYDKDVNKLPRYEANSDVHQENMWEESQIVVATTDEVECEQTLESDFQANTTTNKLHDEDKVEFAKTSTWEENQIMVAATNEVECVQTIVLNSNPKNIDKPSSSATHPLDGNLDFKWSLSTDTNEGDVEEINEKDNHSLPDSDKSIDLESLTVKLMQEVEMLKGSQLNQTVKINLLEQELHESKLEIQQLRNRLGVLEIGSQRIVDPAKVIGHRSWFSESVFIVGGYDGSLWLPTLDSYFPSLDIKNPLSSMNFVKKYASAATFNGELYHFGGMGSHTVESFIPTKNQWVSRPPLHWKNMHVAGASINDKLFVVGGANGQQCSSEVEYLDLNIGRWLPTRSMQSKRLAPAAAELNNVLYVAGGYDGVSYLSSVERFDPREEAWCKLPSMNTRKGCHSMVVLNDKIYTVGGFDGDKCIATVETLDTRMGCWVEMGAMRVARGNFGAFVMGGTLYAIGGLKEKNEVLDSVECYKEGSGWEVADLKAIGKRSHFSAILL